MTSEDDERGEVLACTAPAVGEENGSQSQSAFSQIFLPVITRRGCNNISST